MTREERTRPTIAAPARKGAGSWLIERGLLGATGGEVAMSYRPEGVICTLTAPLSGFENES